MTWVLVLVVCATLIDPSTCEDRVLAHGLSEAECQALARPLSARGEITECLREEHDVFEEPEDDNGPAKKTLPGQEASNGSGYAAGQPAPVGQRARPGPH